MRYLLSFLLAVLFSNAAFAQETVTTENATEAKEVEEFQELKSKVNKAKDRVVLDFTYDMLLNTPDSVSTKGFSRGFNVYFMYDVVLGKSRFSVAPGLGLGTNNYFHNNNITSDSLGTYFTKISDNIDSKKNKINLTYVDIPVEFRFRSKPNAKNNSWKLAAGIKAGIIIQSKWKYKGEEIRAEKLDNPSFASGSEVKFKEFNIENLNRFRYGLTLRGGYGMWNAFIYYSLSDLFEDGRGPRMTPLSFGISINGL